MNPFTAGETILLGGAGIGGVPWNGTVLSVSGMNLILVDAPPTAVTNGSILAAGWQTVATLAGTAAQYLITGLVDGQQYYVQVYAKNSAGITSIPAIAGPVTVTNGSATPGLIPYSIQPVIIRTAIDLDGNIVLKTIAQPAGVTSGTTLSSGFADLADLGSANPDMTVTVKGNPVLVGFDVAFSSFASGGQVTGIAISNGGEYSGTTGVHISIVGDGTGATATPVWGAYPGDPVNSTLTGITITGGSGYTYATASITGGAVVSAATLGAVSISASTPNAGTTITLQLLMDGSVIIGPFTAATDDSGNLQVNKFELLVPGPSAGSHLFQVQAFSLSSNVVIGARDFKIVELG